MRFPIEYYPKPDAVRAVQIDIDAQRIGLRYPVEAAAGVNHHGQGLLLLGS